VTTLRVFRWSPGQADRWQEFAVEAGPDTTVLDALVEAQRRQDPSLAFRYACRVGMCGSCGMVIGGRERWACRTRLATLGPGPVTVRPLYHFPLLRDLVVDMTPFVDRMRAAGAAFVPGRPEPARSAGETEGRPGLAGASPSAGGFGGRPEPPMELIPPDSAERREIDDAIECIGCGMCLSACTMVAHNARFPGPAALNRVFTLERDRRDAAGPARWPLLLSDDALARCHGQGTCTEVCPMGLAPTRSILRLRRIATRRLLGLA
jgi:fumarate reductase iron-sulfur subunit